MAAVPAQVVPEVAPQGASPDRYTRVSAEPVNRGPGIGGGLEALGHGALQAGEFFNKVAADDAANSYQEGVNKILYGDPDAKGPNGEQDTGYLGLKGRAALDARPAVDKKMDDLRKTLRGGLLALKSDLEFDNLTRRYKAITDGQVGNHARTQANVYASHVNSATSKLAIDEISSNYDDPAKMQDATQRLINARIKQAELEGGGPELMEQAYKGALRDGLTAQLQAMAVTDPARAIRTLEKNRAVAGAQYDNLYNSFRARAGQQVGRERADGILGVRPIENGEDTKNVLRHFEGFISRAERDNGGEFRVGYGSDTITRADGKIEKVTPNTVITREDAERDLERRATASQNDARRAIGDEAWDKLDARAKASLTSISYNYGPDGFPKSVAEAARTGDKDKISQAILGLSGHNAGINARRRAQEAANVRGETGVPKTQAEALQQAMDDPVLADNPEALPAALSRINQSYAIENTRRTKEKAAFETRVKNGAAESLDTGKVPTDPVPESDFVKQYGAAEGPLAFQRYNNEVQFGVVKHSFEEMPGAQIRQTIDNQKPTPGSKTYANEANQVDRLRKEADKLQKDRREDPGGSVSRQTAVKEAAARFDPKNPESYRPVAEAMLAAQENLEIEPENRAPLTKALALDLTVPLMRALSPEQQIQALQQLGVTFRAMFGENAGQAFAYAMRARNVHGETAQNAAAIMGDLASGKPLTEAEKRGFREAQATAAADNAVRGQSPAVQQPWMYQGGETATPDASFGMTPGAQPFKGDKRQFPTPNSDAIQNLIRGKMTDKQYDTLYGPGAAKQLMDRLGMKQIMRQAKPDGR